MGLLAHVREDEEDGWIIHELEDHLTGVAEFAERFAKKFNNKDWLTVASQLHDLGKGSDAFQNKIKKKSGYDPEAHIRDGDGIAPHSTHGAVWAVDNFPQVGKILAYIIAGHHGKGMPDWSHEIGVGGNLEHRLSSEEREKLPLLTQSFIDEITKGVIHPTSEPPIIEEEHFHLWIRMLYSCLVDADFLDTERFMNKEKFENRGQHSSIADLKVLFDAHMVAMSDKAPVTPVNKIRAEVLLQCREEASKSSGLFTLTVPTGGGKTLSSMAFALEHALIHKKERVIMVIPYTSIIAQTSQTYKEIFGEENVIEHHSSLDPKNETSQSRLATENWDAPIIVTTSVQFFESLFAARSSTCRKLHNIVNSVVIIDEVQMLPTDYLKPILHTINGLTNHFGVSMVLCSATQPAITSEIFQKGGGEYYTILEKEHCREIMTSPSPEELTIALQRVEVEQYGKVEEWQDLTDKLLEYEQVLTVVNTRNDCRDLFECMPEGTIHLSGNICGEHRSKVIEGIKESLNNGESIRVVSTQLVEAGVDFDFPVVFRAMAGFDSIAQAAGRCNREGKLHVDGIKVKGKVFVFDAPKPAPAGTLSKGEEAGRTILSTDPEGCKNLLPATFTKYFENYFSDLNTFDKSDIYSLLVKDAVPAQTFNFAQQLKSLILLMIRNRSL